MIRNTSFHRGSHLTNKNNFPDTLAYIVYMDDSSLGASQKERRSPLRMMTAVVIRGSLFGKVEELSGTFVENLVPRKRRKGFEFHAKDLFHCSGPFKGTPKEECHALLENGLRIVEVAELSVLYGAVDRRRLHGTVYAGAHPLDVAFSVCADSLESWFDADAPNDLGLIIADDTQNKEDKQALRDAFRRKRPKVRSSSAHRGELRHFADDMYFGDSGDSIGIQLADMCGFMILRNLQEKHDSEKFYEIIRPQLKGGKVVPEAH